MNISLVKATDSELVFSDGTKVTQYHEQDCCENVYADFGSLQDQIGVIVPHTAVENVPNQGFRIGGLFVPCYDEQNGYYSSNLDIYVERPNEAVVCIPVSSNANYC